ncbi:hypothetical protein [Embleya scabrispora]|uniref:hypothetical protein n=1 Tax=Embleya scabrispora TaxID=159449 RepID=UPI0003699BF2|nr:hypothetical protein [Embleya scabrispora]MYS82762.1 hypothetical protein [Streptomyces sp. SID5474]
MTDDLRRGDRVEHNPPPGEHRYPDGRLMTDDPLADTVDVFAAASRNPDELRWTAPRWQVRRVKD